jgi:quercetin dioxygenase-like cupin family protein
MDHNKGKDCSCGEVKTLPNEAAMLTTLIKTQKDSIVSRSILDKPTGSVTLFAFDEGQKLSEHTAPFDAMVYLVEGEAEVTIAQQIYHIKQGEMIIMPANLPHAVNAAKPFKMLLTMIKS